ncbi:LLM class flavin-dependent oxidoreductase [Exiguobacterium flavidum]|uniref:LLM class flavin-dependent oxidoreductase n=1 Tax=Exiguobacterium flavidum TaxID=2184695 RepID=UPI000DF82923|nr:LLM class flavin-dependent oxidoreductase [Exiguobacterium flavidum]
MKIGILDQVPLHEGMDVKETVEATLRLVKEAERLGYSRYWFAEHHNTNGLLSAAPELFIARAGAETSTIRLGAGGILLPQYNPLKVAETFSTLCAFFPGRIDLGVGRSPGGSERTRLALTDGAPNDFEKFPRQLSDVIGYLGDTLSFTHRYRTVKTTPRGQEVPPVWLLGLSPESGKLAGELGIGLVFGHFINPDKWEATLSAYRTHFKAGLFETPRVLVCVFAVAADTQEEAERLARTQDSWVQNIKLGHSIVPTPEKAGVTRSDSEERQMARERRRMLVGTGEDVVRGLEALAAKYETDEFLLINNAHGQEARLTSYALIARAAGLAVN